MRGERLPSQPLYFHDDALCSERYALGGRVYQTADRHRPAHHGHLTPVSTANSPTKLLLIDTLETTNRLLTHFQAEFGNGRST